MGVGPEWSTAHSEVVSGRGRHRGDNGGKSVAQSMAVKRDGIVALPCSNSA